MSIDMVSIRAKRDEYERLRKYGMADAMAQVKAQLSERRLEIQREVCRALYEGASTTAVGEALGVKSQSIRNYKREYLAATGFETLSEAFGGVAEAAQAGTLEVTNIDGHRAVRIRIGEGGTNDTESYYFGFDERFNEHEFARPSVMGGDERYAYMLYRERDGRRPEWVTDEIMDEAIRLHAEG